MILKDFFLNYGIFHELCNPIINPKKTNVAHVIMFVPFNMFNNLDTHLPKLCLCFNKCNEFSMSLISPHWDIEFHVHIDVFNLASGVMLA